MKTKSVLINLSLVLLVWMCLAFACNSGDKPTGRSTGNSRKTDDQTTGKYPARSPTPDDRDDDDSTTAEKSPTTGGKTINGTSGGIPGTYWSLISMNKKSDAAKDNSNPPDVEFCKSGEWGMLHYGGTREAGKYQVQGSRLVMKYEDGSLFGDFTMSQSGNILTLEDEEWILRLRSAGPAGC